MATAMEIPADALLLKFSEYLECPPPDEILNSPELSRSALYEKLCAEEVAELEAGLDWLLYPDERVVEARAALSDLEAALVGVQETCRYMERSVDRVNRLAREIDGDLRSRLNMLSQLRSLLWVYDLANTEVFMALAENDSIRFIELVKTNGIQEVLNVFSKIDLVVAQLRQRTGGGGMPPSTGLSTSVGLRPELHPEAPSYVERYIEGRRTGLRILVETSNRTLATILQKLDKKVVESQMEAQAVVTRNFRDSESVIKAVTFLPYKFVHVRCRVMGSKSILPITQMMNERILRSSNASQEYKSSLNKLFDTYLMLRIKWISSSLKRELQFVFHKAVRVKPSHPTTGAESVADKVTVDAQVLLACQYWIDFAQDEIDTLGFFFVQSRLTPSDKLIQILSNEVYDTLRSFVLPIVDIPTLKNLVNRLHQLIQVAGPTISNRTATDPQSTIPYDSTFAMDPARNSLHPVLHPVAGLQLDVQNKLTSRILELFVRRQRQETYRVENLMDSSSHSEDLACTSANRELPVVKSLDDMFTYITHPIIGHDLHIPVVNGAVVALDKIDSVLDTSVLSLLANDIMESVESRLVTAVRSVSVKKGVVEGALLGCRELLHLYRSLGPSIMHVLMERTNHDDPTPKFSDSIRTWVGLLRDETSSTPEKRLNLRVKDVGVKDEGTADVAAEGTTGDNQLQDVEDSIRNKVAGSIPPAAPESISPTTAHDRIPNSTCMSQWLRLALTETLDVCVKQGFEDFEKLDRILVDYLQKVSMVILSVDYLAEPAEERSPVEGASTAEEPSPLAQPSPAEEPSTGSRLPDTQEFRKTRKVTPQEIQTVLHLFIQPLRELILRTNQNQDNSSIFGDVIAQRIHHWVKSIQSE